MGQEGSHDWYHIERVWNLARRLLQEESGLAVAAGGPAPDGLVVELAALLHDIADAKFHGGDESLGPNMAREWLEGQSGDHVAGRIPAMAPLEPRQIKHVATIIATMSYRHGRAGFEPDPADREYAIVRDADRLDALGAIGIARCFAFGGARGRALWIPGEGPECPDGQSSLHHFWEKLLKLQDGMLTASGRRLAAGRHAYLADFVERFQAEWRGDC
jgi:uncharacterized protein